MEERVKELEQELKLVNGELMLYKRMYAHILSTATTTGAKYDFFASVLRNLLDQLETNTKRLLEAAEVVEDMYIERPEPPAT